MRNRLIKPLALFVALFFMSGGVTAALGTRTCVYHAGAEGTHDAHVAQTAATGAHASGGSQIGHPGCHHAPSDASPGGDDDSTGCSCFGHCIGCVVPLAISGSRILRVVSLTRLERAHPLSDSELLSTQTTYLLPFANAPPAVS